MTCQVVAEGSLDRASSGDLNHQTISCTHLRDGFYFIQVAGPRGAQTVKFVKY